MKVSVEPKYSLVLIHWVDHTSALEWTEFETAYNWEGFEFDHNCWQVGFLIRKEDDHVILASQATQDFKQVANVARIPTGMIVSITYLSWARTPPSASV